MIYNKKITKDIVTSMTMLRNNGKSVEASARQTARALSKKYGAKFKWTGVRGKFYEVKPVRSKTKTKPMPKTNSMPTTNTTAKSLRTALASMATDSNSVTIQITGNMVTVVYK
tara:strand:- start:1134 stop:1472 length:339 start_codon:yes stop_codon:yes gene_type:complete